MSQADPKRSSRSEQAYRCAGPNLTVKRQAVIAEFEAGGGPLTIDLPSAEDIAISSAGDAATTAFDWRARIRSADGIVSDRSYYETDVWYRRNGIWKIICMHLARLSLSPVASS